MPRGVYVRTPRTLNLIREAVVVIGLSIGYVELTKGQFCLVDADNISWISKFNWCASKAACRPEYYAFRNDYSTGKQKLVGMHRYICGLGPLEPSRHVDHVNRNTLDNRRANLRQCTASENHGNQGLSRNNTSGLKGAYWDKGNGFWFASIRIKNRQIWIGKFNSPEECHAAYMEAAKKYKGEFARFS